MISVRYLALSVFLATAFTPPSMADETVSHISGSSWTWPGKDPVAGDYLASGLESLTQPFQSSDSAIMSGGFVEPLGLMSLYGTYTRTVSTAAIDALLRRHSSRISITPVFRQVIRLTAADIHVYRVLRQFLELGGSLAPVSTGGRYTHSPLRIIVGIEDGRDVIDSGKTLFHELLHFAFDKVDSILWEAHDPGGADHQAIARLEERFLLIQQLRAGLAPLHSGITSIHGFTRLGKIAARLEPLLEGRDSSALRDYVESDEFHTAYVHSALVTPLSSRYQRLSGASSGLVLSEAQIQDLASLAAYHATILAGALTIAADLQESSPCESLSAVLRTAEFQRSFRSYVARMAYSRDLHPTGAPRAQGTAALEAAGQ